MRFWDSSAIVPLLVEEPETARREQGLREDSEILLWYSTPAEIESALNRRRREGVLLPEDDRIARGKLRLLEEAWHEVQPTLAVRDRALRLLRVHALRAADAFQLSAALVACAEQTRDCSFYTADGRLREAAAAEGFTVA